MSLTQVHLSKDAKLLLDFMRRGKPVCFSCICRVASKSGPESETDVTAALVELFEAKLVRVAEVEKMVAWVWYEAVPVDAKKEADDG